MARKLRLGIIGTGLAADRLYLPAFRELGNRIDLVACTNRTRQKAVDYAERAGVEKVYDTPEELIADPGVEAVLVSLPIDVMPGYVLAALRAGKPVISEKPLAADVAAGRRLVKQAADLDVPYLVGENFGFMSTVHQMARWVESGKVGTVRLAEVHQLVHMDRSSPYFNTSWRANPSHIGGFVADGGVHIAHALRRIMGDPVTVKSLTAQFDPDLPPTDTVVAALQFESGALGTWTSCFSATANEPFLRIYGDRANIIWYRDRAELVTPAGKVTTATDRENSFTAQFRHFADVVTKGTPVAVTPGTALGDLVLIDRLLRSR